MRQPRKRRNLKRRIIGWGAILAFAGWLAGLIVFANEIPTSTPPIENRTDAIVVLTGGTMRLDEGLKLLEAGAAGKLFVSGVHRGVDVAELLRVSRQSPEDLDCCIVLGYEADDTIGNARETAAWVKENGYRSIRLVTAGYHMPRALMELQHAMPGVDILPHPVHPDHVKTEDWFLYPGTLWLIAGEYTKSLAVPVRWWLEAARDRILGLLSTN